MSTAAQAREALEWLVDTAETELDIEHFATLRAFIEAAEADARQLWMLDHGMELIAKQCKGVLATNSRALSDWRADLHFIAGQAEDIRAGAVITRTDPTYGTTAYKGAARQPPKGEG